ncbi:MAG: metal ABC transporter substrate-binding protein [Candidatus Binatia bacterium]
MLIQFLARASELLVLLLVHFFLTTEAVAAPLRVCATVPDLGDLAREVGGDEVTVTIFAKGTEDAHFVEPRPSFVRALADADLYLQVGLELEVGWAPALLKNARNANVLPGNAGYLDGGSVITPLEIPSTPVDRSMGDVHPLGNPHYLVDPRNGLKIAAAIRDRLAGLRAEKEATFAKRYDDFAKRLGRRLVGDELAAKYDPVKLSILYENGKLDSFLASQKETAKLGGWLGELQPRFGIKAVSDHNLWPYFAAATGLRVVAFLEPKPGISPTTRHLEDVIQRMRAEKIPLILAAPYYDRRHADFVARESGAKIVRLAHQVGSREGAVTYLEMIDTNVRAIVAALGSRR